MSSVAKNVLYGTKQEAILSPKVGYEVESVEVFNKTTNETVPSQLTKTCDNPPQWTCTFYQPAGVVSIRPKMKPTYFSVIIEECENCSIVLLESNDVVNVKMAALNNADTGENSPSSETASAETATERPHCNEAQLAEENGNAAGADGGDKQDVANQNNDDAGPNDEGIVADGADEHTNTENNDAPQSHDGQESDVTDAEPDDEEDQDDNSAGETQDEFYDAGQFASELEDVQPVVITRAEYDKKCASYWQHRHKFNAGEITKDVYDNVEKKHMEFMDDISSGRVIIQ